MILLGFTLWSETFFPNSSSLYSQFFCFLSSLPHQRLPSDSPSRLALSRGLRSWGGLPELEGALPREEAPGSVVAVVTLEVGGPGWGALRTQG